MFITSAFFGFIILQNYLNSYLHDTNGSSNAIIPSWMPDDISASRCTGSIQLKLLCGADLLESFAVPGLWKASDVGQLTYIKRLNNT